MAARSLKFLDDLAARKSALRIVGQRLQVYGSVNEYLRAEILQHRDALIVALRSLGPDPSLVELRERLCHVWILRAAHRSHRGGVSLLVIQQQLRIDRETEQTSIMKCIGRGLLERTARGGYRLTELGRMERHELEAGTPPPSGPPHEGELSLGEAIEWLQIRGEK
ncbi:MAG: hypothetical protein DHS20C21_01810 [Gemmatimonadota bacterium]|nr:MAG: hypothetical protein DHS20C21_01810 [Gemmatimonadota bacterium]